MKTLLIVLLLLCLFLISCEKSTMPIQKENEQNDLEKPLITGMVEYFVDTLLYIGGEGDPTGFILSNYQWLNNEPHFKYYRVYIDSNIDSTYLLKKVKIWGRIDTLHAGGIETPLRKFPIIKSDSTIIILSNKK